MPSNALDYLTIRGFKSIASLEKLPLRPINILIGANGSGKSNFIGVFPFLHAIREGRLQDYVTKAGGADRILHFGAKVTKEIHFELSFANKVNSYNLTLGRTQDDGLYPTSETAYFWNKLHPSPYSYALAPRERGREAGISSQDLDKVPDWVSTRLGGWRLYHVHDTSSTSPMRGTAKLHDNKFLRSDASNLAPFLYLLRERHKNSYEVIRSTLQRVAPFFDDFRLEPSRLSPDDIRLEWKHRNSDLFFDASSFSDGTLRFLALSTLFLQPSHLQPSVILVDEPELGLHPFAIAMLASLIRQAATTTQVIASTQSSLLLDYVAPDDVLVANRTAGSTQITRLEPERLTEWSEEYSLGQLWEKNELEGRPSPETR
jgi:predicted ATPase